MMTTSPNNRHSYHKAVHECNVQSQHVGPRLLCYRNERSNLFIRHLPSRSSDNARGMHPLVVYSHVSHVRGKHERLALTRLFRNTLRRNLWNRVRQLRSDDIDPTSHNRRVPPHQIVQTRRKRGLVRHHLAEVFGLARNLPTSLIKALSYGM